MLPELNAVAFRVEEADELALSLGVCPTVTGDVSTPSSCMRATIASTSSTR
jgi:hypothetical protein